jgi:hypothetical protein
MGSVHRWRRKFRNGLETVQAINPWTVAVSVDPATIPNDVLMAELRRRMDGN